MKILKPEVGENLTSETNLVTELYGSVAAERAYELKKVTSQIAVGEDFSTAEISFVVFDSCRFSQTSFHKSSLCDVIFNSCDLSNCDFTGSYFNRCAFYDCKGVGTLFCDSVFYNTSFEGCNIGFSNFTLCKLDRVLFSECKMCDATLSQIKLKNTEFSQSNMQNTAFFETVLCGVDLTSNNIEGITVSESLRELRGAVLSAEQACMIARMLGICIE